MNIAAAAILTCGLASLLQGHVFHRMAQGTFAAIAANVQLVRDNDFTAINVQEQVRHATIPFEMSDRRAKQAVRSCAFATAAGGARYSR